MPEPSQTLLRPRLALVPEHQPWAGRGDVRDRLGLVAVPDRQPIRAAAVAGWRELIPFFITSATTVIESVVSRELSQPFVLDWISLWVNQAIQSGQRITFGLMRGTDTPAAVQGNFTPIAVSAANDLGLANRLWPDAEPAQVPVGLRVEDVPCRLLLLLDNQSAASTNVGGAWSVTHLRPPCRGSTPPYENGSAGL